MDYHALKELSQVFLVTLRKAKSSALSPVQTKQIEQPNFINSNYTSALKLFITVFGYEIVTEDGNAHYRLKDWATFTFPSVRVCVIQKSVSQKTCLRPSSIHQTLPESSCRLVL